MNYQKSIIKHGTYYNLGFFSYFLIIDKLNKKILNKEEMDKREEQILEREIKLKEREEEMNELERIIQAEIERLENQEMKIEDLNTKLLKREILMDGKIKMFDEIKEIIFSNSSNNMKIMKIENALSLEKINLDTFDLCETS
jgi:hypothetical protein